MFLTTGIFLPPISATALLLNRQFEDDKDIFPEFAKKILSNSSIGKSVWESLNEDVQNELLKLGYKPEADK